MACANGHSDIVDILIGAGAVSRFSFLCFFARRASCRGRRQRPSPPLPRPPKPPRPQTKLNQTQPNNNPQDVNAANAQGNTPLHWACLNGQRPCAERLLEAGASAAVLNRAGRTAVDEALGRPAGGEELLALINRYETAGRAVEPAGGAGGGGDDGEEREGMAAAGAAAGGAGASTAMEEEVAAEEAEGDEGDDAAEAGDRAAAAAAAAVKGGAAAATGAAELGGGGGAAAAAALAAPIRAADDVAMAEDRS